MRSPLIVLFCLFLSFSVHSQNCGLVDSVITTITDNGNGTSDYYFEVHKSTTSGGGKSVAVVLFCGTDTFVNGACELTNTSPDTVFYGPFTVATCSTQIYLDWSGHTNTVCGGTTCRSVAGTPVPVSWLSFNLKCINLNTLLYWETASEINNRGFDVQFQDKSGNWMSIAFVDGQYNLQNIRSYSYDVSAWTDKAEYFRIVQYDYNGATSHSDVVQNKCPDEHSLNFYPNPTTSSITFNAFVVSFEIRDSYGALIKQGGITNSIELEELADGMYYIQFTDGITTVYKRIVKISQ